MYLHMTKEELPWIYSQTDKIDTVNDTNLMINWFESQKKIFLKIYVALGESHIRNYYEQFPEFITRTKRVR